MNRPALLIMLVVLLFACDTKPKKNDFSKTILKIEQKAQNINNELKQIRLEADKLAQIISQLYVKQDSILPTIDKSKYTLSDNGVFYKPKDDGGSAIYISAAKRGLQIVKNVAYFSELMDSELIRVTNQYEAVVQAYYNDCNNLNRIYPFIDVLAQYEPALDITSFNFYYLADEKHNPERKSVWVEEAYVDPAGRGWMVSAIAPVYYKDKLVGVPGIDITTNTLTEAYLSEDDNIVIIDKHGVIVTAKDYSINLLSLPPLKDHRYIETIKMDTYRRNNYNLLKSKEKNVRAMAKKIIEDGETKVEFMTKNSKYIAFAQPINQLSWVLIDFEEIK